MLRRLTRLPAVLLTLLSFIACGDATGPRASLDVVTDTLSARAFTGSTPGDGTALNTQRAAVVRTELGSGFDVVFDIDQQGRPVLYPPSAIAAFGRAGLQKATGTFEQVTEAPVSGYDESATVTAAVGDVYLIRAAPQVCAINIRPFVYSKIAIDSVNATTRTIHFRLTVNPNCGFRSFAEGVPRF